MYVNSVSHGRHSFPPLFVTLSHPSPMPSTHACSRTFHGAYCSVSQGIFIGFRYYYFINNINNNSFSQPIHLIHGRVQYFLQDISCICPLESLTLGTILVQVWSAAVPRTGFLFPLLICFSASFQVAAKVILKSETNHVTPQLKALPWLLSVPGTKADFHPMTSKALHHLSLLISPTQSQATCPCLMCCSPTHFHLLPHARLSHPRDLHKLLPCSSRLIFDLCGAASFLLQVSAPMSSSQRSLP